MLLAFGEPVPLGDAAASGAAWNARLEAALAAAMDRLADAARGRDPSAFTTLVAGRRGVNPVYDLWRRGRAALTGQTFDAGHGDVR